MMLNPGYLVLLNSTGRIAASSTTSKKSLEKKYGVGILF